MKAIHELTSDMRALSALITSVADDLDAVSRLFGGGAAIATPFAPDPPPSVKPESHPTDDATKLLIRQLWFSRPQKDQTLNLKREISRKTGTDPRTVAIIIRKTPPSDLSAFLKSQGQSS